MGLFRITYSPAGSACVQIYRPSCQAAPLLPGSRPPRRPALASGPTATRRLHDPVHPSCRAPAAGQAPCRTAQAQARPRPLLLPLLLLRLGLGLLLCGRAGDLLGGALNLVAHLGAVVTVHLRARNAQRRGRSAESIPG